MFVRWENLSVEAAEQTALPGYREPAVIRHFDAPEALDTRFYEVRAKSALNRVPERSRMPFRWTINPYRGCSHACVYCLWGETPILMGDGRTKPIAELGPGDEIYGTEFDGRYRRYVRTQVLDKWSSIKPAYRTVLEDGTELLSSADHRFLTDRGWKHVAPATVGQRPCLTSSNELLGIGGFAAAPQATLEYRRGYLCGVIRGDGTVGSYAYELPHRISSVHRFRLALADLEALQRTRLYLSWDEVHTDEFAFAAAGESRRAITAIRTQRRDAVERVRSLIAWPQGGSDDWCKGFLAGIFDAEGGCSRGILRISNTDDEIIRWIVACFDRFGFHVVVERSEGRATTVRLRGGLRERLRFFHLVDPAIRRKCDIAGMAIKSDADLKVASVEPVGATMRLYDITTGTGDFIANGVVSHNCFARPTHKYLDMGAGRDFEKEIVVKVNAPEVLRVELRRPAWKREHVAMGTNTDPYQWVESKYKLMPPILEALRDSGTPCSVLTKSPLLLRDLDLLRSFVDAGVDVSAAFSVPTLEEKAWRASEPHTPHPRKRLEAVGELNRAGIPTGILIAPLMPGINDDPKQVEKILDIAGEMGAVSIGGIALHLRGEVRGVFMDWLRSYRPDLVDEYERLYARGAYAPPQVRERLARMVRKRNPARGWRGEQRRVAARPDPAPDGVTGHLQQRSLQETLF